MTTETATNFVQESVGRLEAARDRLDSEVQRVQKELRSRRKNLEKQLASGRRSFEKQTRKQVRQLEKGLRENPLLKRANGLRETAAARFETAMETILDTLQLASKGDVEKIERKLGKLSKRVKEIEGVRPGNGRARA